MHQNFIKQYSNERVLVIFVFIRDRKMKEIPTCIYMQTKEDNEGRNIPMFWLT